jgi:hypothetical protein
MEDKVGGRASLAGAQQKHRSARDASPINRLTTTTPKYLDIDSSVAELAYRTRPYQDQAKTANQD